MRHNAYTGNPGCRQSAYCVRIWYHYHEQPLTALSGEPSGGDSQNPWDRCFQGGLTLPDTDAEANQR